MVFYAIVKRAAGLHLSLLVLCSLAYADIIDSIHLLKISPQDERAVVKMEDGVMKIIKPGDPIGKSGKVIEIASGRVVIEEQTERGKETVIIRLEESRQRIERLKKVPDSRPELYRLK